MEKLKLCRICLVENVRMHVVADSHLQEIFVNLTNIPFITEDSRPMLACFFCYARLKQCYKFRQKCLEAEAVFTQMLDEECDEQKPIQAKLVFCGGFIKIAVDHISIDHHQQEDENKQVIKEELTGGCEIINDVEIKVEYQSDASDQEIMDGGYPGCDDNRIAFQSNSDDDIPLTKIKTEVEQVNKKRRAINKEREAKEKSAPDAKKLTLDIRKVKLEDTLPTNDKKNEQGNSKVIDKTQSSAPDAKKPKLNIRKEKLEDTLPTNDKKNEQGNSKVIDKTQSSKFKSVSKIKESIKSNSCDNTAISTNIGNNIDNDDLKCNNSSIYSDDIKQHGLNRRKKSKTILHKCNVCQRSFTRRNNLGRHIRSVHTGEKPYKCNICQRSFTEMKNLQSHTRRHTGERPFICDTCQRGFITKGDLKFHMRVHTGERPYKCDVCQRRFKHPSALRDHIRLHVRDNSIIWPKDSPLRWKV